MVREGVLYGVHRKTCVQRNFIRTWIGSGGGAKEAKVVGVVMGE